MSEQVVDAFFSNFDPRSEDIESFQDRDLLDNFFSPRPQPDNEEWESWLFNPKDFHDKPRLEDDEPVITKCCIRENQQESPLCPLFVRLADSPHYSETSLLSEDGFYFKPRDQTFNSEEIDCQPKHMKTTLVQEIESNSHIHRENKKEKRTRCSASKKYPGQLSVGFAKYMIKERLCPKDPMDQKLITALKNRINGRSKRVDKKDEYKLSSAEKVYAFFHASGEQLSEEDRKVRMKLKQHFQKFFECGLWEDWLRTYFKGDQESKIWISRNIGEIQKKLFNPEYQPNFKHNEDGEEEEVEEQKPFQTYQEHGFCY
jgi:hypothetical protein